VKCVQSLRINDCFLGAGSFSQLHQPAIKKERVT